MRNAPHAGARPAVKKRPAQPSRKPAGRRATVREERREARQAAETQATAQRAQATAQAIARRRAEVSVSLPEGTRQTLLAALIAAGGGGQAVSVIDLAQQLAPGGELVWQGTREEWVKARNAAVLAKRIERRAFKVEEAFVFRGRNLKAIDVLVITRAEG